MSKALTADGNEIDLEIPAEHRENGLEHVSKSRVKTFLQCPRKFYYKYWADNRTPGSYHTEKGTNIHRAFEDFHLNLIDYVEEHGDRPPKLVRMLNSWRDHFQWHDPWVSNFIVFEEQRWRLALDASESREEALELWLPVGVEVEGRLEKPPAGDIPWMGYADAVLHAATVPQVEEDEGVVILDYKTGKTEDKQYRDEGIYLEGEFYGWLFQEDPDFEHEVVAVGGFYPQGDDLVISPYPDYKRRNVILDAVEGMQQPPEIENYDLDEGALCHYGHGRCFFYDVCPTNYGMEDGPGWHSKAEPDGSVNPK